MWTCPMPNQAFQRTTRQVWEIINNCQGNAPYVELKYEELAAMVDCAPKTVYRAVAALRVQGRLIISRSERDKRVNRFVAIPES